MGLGIQSFDCKVLPEVRERENVSGPGNTLRECYCLPSRVHDLGGSIRVNETERQCESASVREGESGEKGGGGASARKSKRESHTRSNTREKNCEKNRLTDSDRKRQPMRET